MSSKLLVSNLLRLPNCARRKKKSCRLRPGFVLARPACGPERLSFFVVFSHQGFPCHFRSSFGFGEVTLKAWSSHCMSEWKRWRKTLKGSNVLSNPWNSCFCFTRQSLTMCAASVVSPGPARAGVEDERRDFVWSLRLSRPDSRGEVASISKGISPRVVDAKPLKPSKQTGEKKNRATRLLFHSQQRRCILALEGGSAT